MPYGFWSASTPALKQSPAGVGLEAERRLSIAAFAAEAADDAPRALITAAPRLATVGMNVSASHAASLMTWGAGFPPIVAFLKSGYCVSLWLPQMVTRFTSPTPTPAFFASCAAARFWSSRVMANHRSAGTLGACDFAIRQLV